MDGPGATRVPWVDVALAVGLLVVVEIEVLNTAGADRRWLLVVLGAVFTVPLVWRRRAPLGTLLVVLGGLSVAGGVDPGTDYLSVFMPLALACYSVAAYADRNRAVVGLGLVLAFFAAGTLSDNVRDPGSRPLVDLAYVWGLNIATWALGRIVRRWREQAAALEQRTTELEEEREWRARAAVAEERARIARELHDVISHSVGVMVVQAAAAEQVLSLDAERARGPLLNVQETGRQAVDELRRLLGILRPRDGEEISTILAPQPTLRGLGSLAQTARDGGLTVELHIEGQRRELPLGVELAAYRVVQEALTNTLKHGGLAATADVTLSFAGDCLSVEVLDRPQPDATSAALRATEAHAGPASQGSGLGLIGMRERVALYGGDLRAGPREAGHGFAVRATFPLQHSAGPS